MIIKKLDQSSLKKFSDPANTHVTTESFILRLQAASPRDAKTERPDSQESGLSPLNECRSVEPLIPGSLLKEAAQEAAN
jgi:hypothetical protein